jgi:hypothetical protein
MNTAWLKRPPVLLLGIAFNVAYLTYLAFSGASDGRPATFAHKAPNGAAPKVLSYYSRDVNQTIVYPAEDLILISEPGRTLLLSPIFTVPGAAPAAPEAVHLRFYSFFGKPRYAFGRRLRITVDGKDVWSSADAIYSANAGEHGEVVESLRAEMPFGKFARAARGGVVKIIVGLEEIELSWGQLQALRRMRQCAVAGSCG